MASIWFLKEGERQPGKAKGQESFAWCVEHLGLQKFHWYEAFQRHPLIIGEPNELAPFREYQLVIVTLDDADLSAKEIDEGWKKGNYLIDMTPEEVTKILTAQ